MAVNVSGIKLDLEASDESPAVSGIDLSGITLDLTEEATVQPVPPSVDVTGIGESDLLDNDEVDTMDFVFDTLPKAAKAGLVNVMASAIAGVGRVVEGTGRPEAALSEEQKNLREVKKEHVPEDMRFQRFEADHAASPYNIENWPGLAASKIAGLFGYDTTEEGQEIQQGAEGVLSEVKKDFAEVEAESGDSLIRRGFADAAASIATTIPATAVGLATRRADLALGLMTSATMAAESQQAVEAGMSWEEARKAGLRSGILEGVMEAAPLKLLFDTVQGDKWLRKAGEFLVAEVGTEIATTAFQNLNALASYNPDMTAGEFVDDLVRTAIAAPIGAGAQVGLFKGVQKAAEGVETVAKKVLSGRQEAPALATDLGEEVFVAGQKVKAADETVTKLRAKLEQITQEIATRGQETIQRLDQSGALDEVDAFLMEQEAKHGENRWLNDPARTWGQGSTDKAWNDENLDYELNGKPMTERALQPGQVAIAIPKGMDLSGIQRQMEQSDDPKWKAFFQAKLDEYAAERKESTGQLKKAEKIVKAWVKRYSPDIKILLSNTNRIGPVRPGARNLGWAARLADGTQVITADHKATKAPDGTPLASDFTETLAHEFGHALIHKTFIDQPLEVQQALVAEWKDFFSRRRDMTVEEYVVEVMTAGAGKDMIQKLDQSVLKSPMIDVLQAGDPLVSNLASPQWASFQEWLANRMAKKEGFGSLTQKYFTEAKSTLQKFFLGEKRFLHTAKTFDLYLDRLSTGVKLNAAIKSYGRRMDAYRDAMQTARRTAQIGPGTAIENAINTNVPGTPNPPQNGPQRRGASARKSVDRYSLGIQLTAGLEQMTQLNPHIPGVKAYYGRALAMWEDKMKWTERASRTIREWLDGSAVKGKERRQKFADFLFAVDQESTNLGRKVTSAEMQALRTEYGITQQEFALAQKVWGDFDAALQEVEDALVDDLMQKIVSGDTVQIGEQIKQIRNDFAQIKNRNYMPHSRFGKYTVTVYANTAMTEDGRNFKSGQTVFFGTYESERKAMAAKEQMEKKYKGRANVGVGEISDDVRELIDLPPQLAEMLLSKINLDEGQTKQLRDLQYVLMPGQGFKKQLVNRKDVPGYSKDALRVYADYMRKFASHLSKIKHGNAMQEAIGNMKGSATMLRQAGQNAVKRERIAGWYQRHLDYMMNPGNELADLRAIGFVWYLGFLPKAALVNLTQPFMVAVPYLASKYNDVAAMGAMSTAMYQVMKAPYTKKGFKYSLEYDMMFTELTRRGIIDEGMATELAALSEGGFLGRYMQGATGNSPENALRVQRTFEASALMFQAAEKFNRRIVAHAAYSLARKNGLTQREAIEEADRAVRDTQFEYGRVNRPEMMRGKLGGSVFMFWQYLTNMLWFMRNNKGAAARTTALMFLLAGAEGLPFAGNVLDLLDYAMRKFKEMTGWKDPKKGARDYLAEVTQVLEDDPMLGEVVDGRTLRHGVTSDFLGLWDLSASLSMGRIIPGTEYLSSATTPQNAILGTAGQASGALVNIPVSIMSGMMSDSPDSWKNYEKMMPNFAKGISQTVRWAVRGEETDKGGAAIHEFSNPMTMKDMLQVFGRAGGFTPSDLTVKREQMFRSRDAQMYYANRHKGLTDTLNYAVYTGDAELMSETLDRITDFNSTVPYPEMMIQSNNLVQSLKKGQETRMMREMGMPDQLKHFNLNERYKDRYN